MVSEPPSKFNVSDELFFKIFPIFSLIIFGSMIFFSISYRVKNLANNNKIKEIIKVEELEQVKPKKIHPIEKKNRKIFSEKYIDNLKSKYVEFKLKKKKFQRLINLKLIYIQIENLIGDMKSNSFTLKSVTNM